MNKQEKKHLKTQAVLAIVANNTDNWSIMALRKARSILYKSVLKDKINQKGHDAKIGHGWKTDWQSYFN